MALKSLTHLKKPISLEEFIVHTLHPMSHGGAAEVVKVWHCAMRWLRIVHGSLARVGFGPFVRLLQMV